MLALVAVGCGESNDAGSASSPNPNVNDTDDSEGSESSEGNEGNEGSEHVIGISLPNETHLWMEKVIEHAHDHAQAKGINYIMKNAADSNEQITHLDELVQEGVDAILVLPFESEPLTPKAIQIHLSGIPLVVFDRGITTEDYTSFVYGDVTGIGKASAQAISESLDGTGNVFILSGFPMGWTTTNLNGFQDELKNHPGLVILGNESGNFNYDHSYEVIMSAFDRYDQIDAIYAMEDAQAAAALDAIKDAGRTDVKILTGSGDDSSGVFLNHFKQEQPLELVSFLYSYELIRPAIDVTIDAVNGKSVDKEVVIPTEKITTDNVDEYIVN